MPLFEYLCLDCGRVSEVLVTSSQDKAECHDCGSQKLRKLLSTPSSLSGPNKKSMPGPGDTACCGYAPGQAVGCAGPGSCCGKGPT
jgi:putative FmdB family regulatory protein